MPIQCTCPTCGASFSVQPSRLAEGKGKFCSKPCYTATQIGRKNIGHKPRRLRDAVERFWEAVDKDGPIPPHRPDLGSCWVWKKAREVSGYGVFSIKSHLIKAHRFSYRIETGTDISNLNVCHHCDNPPCVRPDHLFLGTQADNNADMIAKGRSRVPSPERRYGGERHHSARLTPALVVEIRRRAADGEMQTSLAREYGVSISAINCIVRRKTWKHEA